MLLITLIYYSLKRLILWYKSQDDVVKRAY